MYPQVPPISDQSRTYTGTVVGRPVTAVERLVPCEREYRSDVPRLVPIQSQYWVADIPCSHTKYVLPLSIEPGAGDIMRASPLPPGVPIAVGAPAGPGVGLLVGVAVDVACDVPVGVAVAAVAVLVGVAVEEGVDDAVGPVGVALAVGGAGGP